MSGNMTLPEAKNLYASNTESNSSDTDITTLVTKAGAPLQLLSPPPTSEGPDAATEYDRYTQRWSKGDTLAQRWARLRASGKAAAIQEEWEDMQLDLMLQQHCANTPAAAAARAEAAAAVAAGGSAAAAVRALQGGRVAGRGARRGRAELEALAAVEQQPPALAEGRRVRARQAPKSLEDFHVDLPRDGISMGASSSDEDFEDGGEAAAAADQHDGSWGSEDAEPGQEDSAGVRGVGVGRLSNSSINSGDGGKAGAAANNAASAPAQHQKLQPVLARGSRPTGKGGPAAAMASAAVASKLNNSPYASNVAQLIQYTKNLVNMLPVVLPGQGPVGSPAHRLQQTQQLLQQYRMQIQQQLIQQQIQQHMQQQQRQLR